MPNVSNRLQPTFRLTLTSHPAPFVASVQQPVAPAIEQAGDTKSATSAGPVELAQIPAFNICHRDKMEALGFFICAFEGKSGGCEAGRGNAVVGAAGGNGW